MAASISIAPPEIALAGNEIWVEIQTDQIVPAPAKIELAISSTGPTTGQTLTITWSGKTLVFTTATSPNASGLQLPLRGALTLVAYADLFAEYLRQNEVLNDDFLITREAASGGSEIIRLAYRPLAALDITATETMTNVTATATDSAGWTTAANLRAVVEVCSDTGNPNTDTSLLKVHAPYDFANFKAKIPIQDAFAHLTPEPPTGVSIPAASVPPSALLAGVATKALQKYYFRFADKFGTIPTAQAMKKSEASYLAQLGSRAGDSPIFNNAPSIAHNWVRNDGGTWWKPVSDTQPDYLFFRPSLSGTYTPTVRITWSNGAETDYTPFAGSPLSVTPEKMFWIGTGFRQLKLQLAPPPVAGATIVRYQVRVIPDDAPGVWLISARYQVLVENADWGMYLLFSTGLGGMETVWMRGKSTTNYETTASEAQRVREIGWTVEQGEFDHFGAMARPSWEVSTGFADETAYLEYLRQLPLAKCWMADLVNRRWKKVIVEAKKMDGVSEDDRDLNELNFTVRAGWLDESFNQ